MEKKIKFPSNLLIPIKMFLERELIKMKKTEKQVKNDAVIAFFVKKQMVQIRKALTMIKLGKYGICESCGKMIDTDRLAVKPDTTICIMCEREKEGR